MNTDFWLDEITWESRPTREFIRQLLLQGKFAFGRLKRSTCTDFAAKCGTVLYFWKNLWQPVTTWFVARQLWTWVVIKSARSLFNLFCRNVAKHVARFCGSGFIWPLESSYSNTITAPPYARTIRELYFLPPHTRPCKNTCMGGLNAVWWRFLFIDEKSLYAQPWVIHVWVEILAFPPEHG